MGKKYLVLVVTLLGLTGCATSYQPKGMTGGFDEVQLSENVWRVSFKGNGYTSRDRTEQFAILRSAELTLMNGYKYFAFVDSRSNVDTSVLPGSTYSTTNMSGAVYGNYMSGTASTVSWGGPMVFSKPSAFNIVVMFKERPNEGFVYDAAKICQSIGKKYDVVCDDQ